MDEQGKPNLPFRVTVGDHSIVGHPTLSEIKNNLRLLDESIDGFMIIEQGPGSFMQCSGTVANGFYIEHCGDGENQQVQSGNDAIALDMTAEIFNSYVKEDGRWRDMISWEANNQEDGIGPHSEPPKQSGFIQRHGNSYVLNLRICLVFTGIVISLLGVASFFFIQPVINRYTIRLPGILLAVGLGCVIMSSFTED